MTKQTRWGLFLVLLVVSALFFPTVGPGRAQAANAKWTFMVYACGDNDTEEFLLRDFKDMSSVGSSNDVNILVELDRNLGFKTDYGNWVGSERFRVTKNMDPTTGNALWGPRLVDMTDPAQLTDFINWGTSNYPADHYALVLADHGGSWLGVLQDYDDSAQGRLLQISDLKTALATANQRMDVVAFDACLMGSFEVAYELKDCTDWIVGSEEEMFGGWTIGTYGIVLSDLTTTPGMGPGSLADAMVNDYSLSNRKPDGTYTRSDATYASVRTGALTYLANAVNLFRQALESDWNQTNIYAARSNAEHFSSCDAAFMDQSVDLLDFARLVKQYTNDSNLRLRATAVMSAVYGAVSNEWHCPGTGPGFHPFANGLTIYFPTTKNYDARYDNIDSSVDTGWNELVRKYNSPEASVKGSIELGLSWLRSIQTSDGDWRYHRGAADQAANVGLTSEATLAFLNTEVPLYRNPTADASISWILNNRASPFYYYLAPGSPPDEAVYDTSMAILAMLAIHSSSYYAIAADAAKFGLLGLQNVEGNGISMTVRDYGGWGSGIATPPELKVSYLRDTCSALEALDAVERAIQAGQIQDSDLDGRIRSAQEKAQVFLARCQNRNASVDVTIDGTTYTITPDPELLVGNDGSFMNRPNDWDVQQLPTELYTAMGAHCLLLIGVSPMDDRLSGVNGALNWLDYRHYSLDPVPQHILDQLPPTGDCDFFRYCLEFARAYSLAEVKGWISWHNWRHDLKSFLMGSQTPGGAWPNTACGRSDNTVNTCEAILAEELIEPPVSSYKHANAHPSLSVTVRSPAAGLRLKDPNGSSVGIDYGTGLPVIQIPFALLVTNDGEQEITIPFVGVVLGNYIVELVGTGNGMYQLEVSGGIDNTVLVHKTISGTISRDAVQQVTVGVSMVAGLTFDVVAAPSTTSQSSCGQVWTATGTGTATLCHEAGAIQNLAAVNPGTLPEPPVENIVFRDGLFSFDLTGVTRGGSATVYIDLPSGIPANAQYWEYDSNHGWNQIDYTVVNSHGIAITLADDGNNGDHVAGDGVINDPGGLGGPGPAGPSGGAGGAGVPVFPSVYVGIGAALGAGVLAYFMRRRLARSG